MPIKLIQLSSTLCLVRSWGLSRTTSSGPLSHKGKDLVRIMAGIKLINPVVLAQREVIFPCVIVEVILYHREVRWLNLRRIHPQKMSTITQIARAFI